MKVAILGLPARSATRIDVIEARVPTGGMEWLIGHSSCIIVTTRETGPIKQAIVEVLEHQSSCTGSARRGKSGDAGSMCVLAHGATSQCTSASWVPGRGRCKLKTAGTSAMNTGRNPQFGAAACIA
jgi:hypothetical protein